MYTDPTNEGWTNLKSFAMMTDTTTLLLYTSLFYLLSPLLETSAYRPESHISLLTVFSVLEK